MRTSSGSSGRHGGQEKVKRPRGKGAEDRPCWERSWTQQSPLGGQDQPGTREGEHVLSEQELQVVMPSSPLLSAAIPG